MRDDWVECKLRDMGNIYSGGTPKTSKPEYWGDEIAWITPADLSRYTKKFISKGNKNISNLGLSKSSAKLIPKGSILFSSRAPIGYVVIAKNDLATNQGFKSIYPFKGLFNEYLYYYLKASKSVAEKNASGTTFREISKSAFAELPLPLPPLPIQRAIVSKIETLFSDLDKGIADLKKTQEQLKIYRQAVLKKAFEGELTKEWREQQIDLPTAEELLEQIKEERQKHYEQQLEEWKPAVKEWEENGKEGKKPGKPSKPLYLTELKEEELVFENKIPHNWIYLKAGNLTDCIVPNRDKPKSFNGDISWVTTPDLDEKSIRINYSKISKGLSKHEAILYNARIIPINSVVMTCVGILGTSAITEQEIVVNQQLHAFLPINTYHSYYLAYYIRYNKSYFNRASTSTTVQYLNKTKCNSMPTPICTIQEQHQIVREIESRLSVCDKVEQNISEALEKSEALRQSILKKAFEGKLLSEAEIEACKREADYEPASVLLERIKKEKAG